ncbi:MAG: ribonuclease HI family protein [Nanoarchaeota archaeon]
MTLDIFTDGGSRGNPGEAGFGIAIYKDGILLEQLYKYLGKKTNNEAEYMAVLQAIRIAIKLKEKEINIYSDSQLVVKQLNGEYKVKAPTIIPIYTIIQKERKELDITFNWIPREQNLVADALANKAMDTKESNI